MKEVLISRVQASKLRVHRRSTANALGAPIFRRAGLSLQASIPWRPGGRSRRCCCPQWTTLLIAAQLCRCRMPETATAWRWYSGTACWGTSLRLQQEVKLLWYFRLGWWGKGGWVFFFWGELLSPSHTDAPPIPTLSPPNSLQKGKHRYILYKVVAEKVISEQGRVISECPRYRVYLI